MLPSLHVDNPFAPMPDAPPQPLNSNRHRTYSVPSTINTFGAVSPPRAPIAPPVYAPPSLCPSPHQSPPLPTTPTHATVAPASPGPLRPNGSTKPVQRTKKEEQTFLWKLWELLQGRSVFDVGSFIHWSENGKVIEIPDERALELQVCQVVFDQKNVTSFNKQMNNWHFRREPRSRQKSTPGAGTEPRARKWYHPALHRDSTDADVKRVKRHAEGARWGRGGGARASQGKRKMKGRRRKGRKWEEESSGEEEEDEYVADDEEEEEVEDVDEGDLMSVEDDFLRRAEIQAIRAVPDVARVGPRRLSRGCTANSTITSEESLAHLPPSMSVASPLSGPQAQQPSPTPSAPSPRAFLLSPPRPTAAQSVAHPNAHIIDTILGTMPRSSSIETEQRPVSYPYPRSPLDANFEGFPTPPVTADELYLNQSPFNHLSSHYIHFPHVSSLPQGTRDPTTYPLAHNYQWYPPQRPILPATPTFTSATSPPAAFYSHLQTPPADDLPTPLTSPQTSTFSDQMLLLPTHSASYAGREGGAGIIFEASGGGGSGSKVRRTGSAVGLGGWGLTRGPSELFPAAFGAELGLMFDMVG